MRFILCSLLLLVGCQASKSTAPLTAAEDGFSARLIPQQTPHLYNVELKWGSPSPVVIHRKGPGSEEAMHYSEEGETGYTDSGLRHGTYVYTLGSEPPIQVKVPRDRVLNAPHLLTHLEGLGRLILGPKAILYTGGQQLNIEVEQLQSEGARIANAPHPTPGLSGGELRIRAKRAVGTLHVDRSGTGGAAGQAGLAGAQGQRGAPGHDAQFRVVRHVAKDYDDHMRSQKPIQAKHTLAYADLLLSRRGRGHPDVTYYLACVSQATSGTTGGRGARGGTGLSGQQGGDQMAVDIRVEATEDWDVVLSGEPGRGGAGGPGGEGGKGGPGGPAGRPERYGICPHNATNGAAGKQGKPGETGEQGLPGRRRPYCVETGNEREGAC